MRNILIAIIFFGLGVLAVLFLNQNRVGNQLSPLGKADQTTDSLNKYRFTNLKKQKFESSEIEIGELVKDEANFSSYMFFFSVDGKKVSGLINIPKQSGIYPVAVLLRGYVDQEIYTTGIGTAAVGEFLAVNNYITLAPDFLGYGESDNPSQSSIEERFQTYTTALTLLASINKLQDSFNKNKLEDIQMNSNQVGLWGHSNGGHIALAVLSITGKKYPTSLWAPVSKPFPYSILYYTDEFTDRGKALRKVIAEFEVNHDIEAFSPTKYLKWIKATMQIHQGLNDDAVPVVWSNQLYDQLKELDKKVEYFIYENADHNLRPEGWEPAVQRTLDLFNQQFSLNQ